MTDWGEWSSCCPKRRSKRVRAILRYPVQNGAACPETLSETRQCSIECESPRMVRGNWSKCTAAPNGNYLSRLCHGIQVRNVTCFIGDNKSSMLACLSGEILPSTRRLCFAKCTPNQKSIGFMKRNNLAVQAIMPMIIPNNQGPVEPKLNTSQVGQWSSCFLDNDTECGTGVQVKVKLF